MSFFDRLKKTLSSPGLNRNLWIHVRCSRCGEVITARIDLMNDLTQDFQTGEYRVHKVLVGDGRYRCFQRIHVDLAFDKNKRLIDQVIQGGEFLHPSQVEEARAAYERAMQEAEEARQARLAELTAKSSSSSSSPS